MNKSLLTSNPPLLYLSKVDAELLDVLYDFGSPMTARVIETETGKPNARNHLQALYKNGWITRDTLRATRGGRWPYLWSITELGTQIYELHAKLKASSKTEGKQSDS